MIYEIKAKLTPLIACVSIYNYTHYTDIVDLKTLCTINEVRQNSMKNIDKSVVCLSVLVGHVEMNGA